MELLNHYNLLPKENFMVMELRLLHRMSHYNPIHTENFDYLNLFMELCLLHRMSNHNSHKLHV